MEQIELTPLEDQLDACWAIIEMLRTPRVTTIRLRIFGIPVASLTVEGRLA